MSLLKHAKQYVANQTKYAHLNAFVSRVDPATLIDNPNAAKPKANDVELHGNPIAIKDNICTRDLKTTAASGILNDFTSPYDATVVKLLRDAGAVVVGKTNMDEFGMGSHSTHSHAGPVTMQRYDGEVASAGGSSGGSAVAVASAQCWAALGTDTGGSVRLPAAYTGVVGFKPSYGLLSRWGVIAYANSLDTVGIFGRNAGVVENVFDKLNVHDAQDPASLRPETRERLGMDEEGEATKPLRIGVPLDYNIATLHPAVKNAWMRALRALAEKGHTLYPVRLPATQHALSAYYVLAPAEASSNLAKYDGVRFGSRAEGTDGTPESVLFAKTRGQGFGLEVQRRILLGAFTLSADAIDNYFIQAQKVRRLVQQDFDNVFAKPNPLLRSSTANEEGADVLLCPTAPTLAPSLSSVQDQDPINAYMNDVFTVPASLAGLPAISVPVHITDEERASIHGSHDIKESAGIQIIGQYGDDKRVLRAAWELQSVLKTVQRHALPDMTAWGTSSLGHSTVNQRKKWASLAVQLGVSIAEAMPIGEAELQRKIERVGNMLDVERGAEHLHTAAAAANRTKEQYIAHFVDAEDPVAEEAKFFGRLMAFRTRVDEGRGTSSGEGETTQRSKETKGRVRAINEEEVRKKMKIEAKHAAKPAWKTTTRERRLAMLDTKRGNTQGVLGEWGEMGKIRFIGNDGKGAEETKAETKAVKGKSKFWLFSKPTKERAVQGQGKKSTPAEAASTSADEGLVGEVSQDGGESDVHGFLSPLGVHDAKEEKE